jgi:RNA polymerase sigma-70 factor (ECF subfamily)
MLLSGSGAIACFDGRDLTKSVDRLGYDHAVQIFGSGFHLRGSECVRALRTPRGGVNLSVHEVPTARPRDRMLSIYEQFNRPIHVFFAKRGFSKEQCQDLAQETFLRVHRGLDGLRSDDALPSWIFTVAASVFKHWLREKSTEKRDAPEVSLETIADPDRLFPSSESPLKKLLEVEELEVLRKAVEELPDKMRRCLLLRLGQDLRYREIAEVMEISIETVKAHLHQAKKLLKAKLDPYFEVPDFDEEGADGS